jgi:hypothetical protein
MQRLINHCMGLFLVFAFLLSSGMGLELSRTGPSRDCCEKEAQGEDADNAACPGPDCLCISCISLVPVSSFQMDKTSFMGPGRSNRPQPIRTSGHSRSIEHPPKSC